MNIVSKIEFREIERISPSQFYSMKNCSYKSVLAEAFGKNPLLPVSPNAYFGTILHKILEMIAKGEIRNEDDFNKTFDEQLLLQEEKLKNQGFSFLIPLQKNVKDFGMKKILLKKHLRTASERPVINNAYKFQSEKWFESKDKLIAGKIDLIIENGNETEIVDFKTGAITQDVLDDDGELFTEIKGEYKEQLMLYAYLYFENTGKFPVLLSLFDLAKQKFSVEFTFEECRIAFKEAKNILLLTNNDITNRAFKGNPTEANCKYCFYRPACSFFLNQLKTDYSSNDVTGILTNVVRYQNGNTSVFLKNADRHITITGFPMGRHEELNDSIKKQLYFFNLRKAATDFIYSVTKTTMIYE